MIDTRHFFAKVVEAAPDFQRAVDEHLADHHELLANLLMGDAVAVSFVEHLQLASARNTRRESVRIPLGVEGCTTSTGRRYQDSRASSPSRKRIAAL